MKHGQLFEMFILTYADVRGSRPENRQILWSLQSRYSRRLGWFPTGEQDWASEAAWRWPHPATTNRCNLAASSRYSTLPNTSTIGQSQSSRCRSMPAWRRVPSDSISFTNGGLRLHVSLAIITTNCCNLHGSGTEAGGLSIYVLLWWWCALI